MYLQPSAAEIERAQAVKEAHEAHAERMKKIETEAWRAAETARWELADALEGILGCSQPLVANPFRNWEG